jgi:hypothetical protein
MAWPAPGDVQNCRDAWRRASLDERRRLASIGGLGGSAVKASNATVLYLHLTDQMLAERSAVAENNLGTEAAARAAQRLEGLVWHMDHPRCLQLGEAFCQADDSMDFALDHCVKTLEECLELVRHAKSGRIGFDVEAKVLITGRASTWAQHAQDCFTLMLYDILWHMDLAASQTRCLRYITEALAKPPPSTKRSWPSKKAFGDLKVFWASLNLEARIRMTLVHPSEYWFIQACDVAMSSRTLREFRGKSLDLNLLVLERLRREARLVASLQVSGAPHPQISLSEAYVLAPDCLDDLYKKAVWHASEKVELVRKALCGNYEDLFQEGSLAPLAKSTSTWADVERVVATLVLEGLLVRYAVMLKMEDVQRQHSAAAARESADLRAAAAQKRRERAKAKRDEARLQAATMAAAEEERKRAEEERKCAEEDRQAAEEARVQAEAERQKAEELRRMQEDARVQAEVERRLAEERRALQRREEACVIRALLARAPCWDVSCLQVKHTFLDFAEEPTGGGVPMPAWDW